MERITLFARGIHRCSTISLVVFMFAFKLCGVKYFNPLTCQDDIFKFKIW